MDAVTYPDKAVQEALGGFVPMRVDVDQRADIAKRFGVQPLPDLRLLTPDGHELTKLVGFTGPAKLAASCRDVLARMRGDASASSRPETRPAPVPTAEVTAENVRASVSRAVAYLNQASRAPSDAPPGYAPDDLILAALAAAGVDSGEPDFSRLRDRVLATPLATTYQAALRALALARLDPRGHRDVIKECARFLATSQLPNGQWSYEAARDPAPALGDNSNSAYGLLGLATCHRAGADVPKDAFVKAATWWLAAQNQDGGWGYRGDRERESYASMTESALAALLQCRAVLGDVHGLDSATARGLAWLKENFSVSENRRSAYQEGRILYHLYALARLGELMPIGDLVGHDWYREAASFLLATQREDGSWDDGADTPASNTAFAVLVLSRAAASSSRPR